LTSSSFFLTSINLSNFFLLSLSSFPIIVLHYFSLLVPHHSYTPQLLLNFHLLHLSLLDFLPQIMV
jgi:hypothetical protein